MTFQLRVVATDKRVGQVILTGDTITFNGLAADVLGSLRERLGDAEFTRQITDGGWSNGYLYLVPAS